MRAAAERGGSQVIPFVVARLCKDKGQSVAGKLVGKHARPSRSRRKLRGKISQVPEKKCFFSPTEFTLRRKNSQTDAKPRKWKTIKKIFSRIKIFSENSLPSRCPGKAGGKAETDHLLEERADDD